MSNENGRSESEMASTGKMISYSFGDIVAYYLLGAYNVFIFFFYEVEVGMPLVLIGLALIIFAIWNAVNDPLIGYLTDRPFKRTKKWGMRFPWILIGAFPTLLFFFLIFTPPDIDVSRNPWPVFLYMVITLCLFDTFYTLFTVHFWGSFTNHFRSDEERRKAAVYDNIIPALGAFTLGIIPPLFIVFGKRESYTLAAFIVVIIMLICIFITIPGVRESEELKEIFIHSSESKEDTSFFKTMREIFREKNVKAMFISLFLLTIGSALSSASGLYFYKDILGLPYSFAVLTAIASFSAFIISVPFWALVAKKIGHAQTYILGIFLVSLAYIPFIWITTIEEAIIFSFLGGIGQGAFWYMILAVLADINDEIALARGIRQEATVFGVQRFFERLAFILQAVILVIIHLITGYNPDPSAKQAPLAILGIRLHLALIPCIFSFIGFLVMYKWFDLKGEKKERIFAELEERGLK